MLDAQRQRLATLQDRRTRAQVKLETDREALKQAQAEAEASFGTSNLEELRALYTKRITEDEQVVMDFILSLDVIESALSDIERQIRM